MRGGDRGLEADRLGGVLVGGGGGVVRAVDLPIFRLLAYERGKPR